MDGAVFSGPESTGITHSLALRIGGIMDWKQKQRYRAAVDTVAHGLAESGPTPTERAEREHHAITSGRTPWNGSGISTRTAPAHQDCAGGCAVADDADHPRHAGHATGCGSHSRRRCGGRFWSSRYGANLVSRTDTTDRLARKGWTK